MTKEACDTDYKNNHCYLQTLRESAYKYELQKEKEELRTLLSWKVGINDYKYEKARICRWK